MGSSIYPTGKQKSFVVQSGDCNSDTFGSVELMVPRSNVSGHYRYWRRLGAKLISIVIEIHLLLDSRFLDALCDLFCFEGTEADGVALRFQTNDPHRLSRAPLPIIAGLVFLISPIGGRFLKFCIMGQWLHQKTSPKFALFLANSCLTNPICNIDYRYFGGDREIKGYSFILLHFFIVTSSCSHEVLKVCTYLRAASTMWWLTFLISSSSHKD